MGDTCNTCLEGTNELKPYPYSSWRMECKFCRKIREIEEYKRKRPERIEEKVDRILALLDT